jgi:hypothetical protein
MKNSNAANPEPPFCDPYKLLHGCNTSMSLVVLSFIADIYYNILAHMKN